MCQVEAEGLPALKPGVYAVGFKLAGVMAG